MEEINLHGVVFKFDPENNKKISNFNWFMEYFKTGRWEIFTYDIFNHCAKKDKIALDIGAWIGPTSIWLSKNFKEVYSFEPDPVAFESLRKNLESSECKNVLPIDKALYSEKTSLGFGVNPAFAHEGLGASTSQLKTDISELIVQTTTFRELSRMIRFEDVSLVKVDIEGSEEHIIEDLFKYASIYKWDVLMEIHPQFMSFDGLENFDLTIRKYMPETIEKGNQKFFRFGRN